MPSVGAPVRRGQGHHIQNAKLKNPPTPNEHQANLQQAAAKSHAAIPKPYPRHQVLSAYQTLEQAEMDRFDTILRISDILETHYGIDLSHLYAYGPLIPELGDYLTSFYKSAGLPLYPPSNSHTDPKPPTPIPSNLHLALAPNLALALPDLPLALTPSTQDSSLKTQDCSSDPPLNTQDPSDSAKTNQNPNDSTLSTTEAIQNQNSKIKNASDSPPPSAAP